MLGFSKPSADIESRVNRLYRAFAATAKRYRYTFRRPELTPGGKPTVVFLGNHSSGKSTIVNLLCRFLEVNIKSGAALYNAYNYVYVADKMNVQRAGSTYTASFVTGRMYETYGASVPTGWLVPFNYLDIGRSTANLAKVRLIVPHSQGHSTASSNVYPYYYELTFQRER